MMRSVQLNPIGMLVGCAVVLSLGLMSPGSVLAGQTKVDVCHSEGAGTYHLINIAEPAYAAHIAHGDAGINEDVPGMTGYVFDAECVPVEAASCPCTFSAEDISASFPENAPLFLQHIGIGQDTGCDYTTPSEDNNHIISFQVTDGATNFVRYAAGGDAVDNFCAQRDFANDVNLLLGPFAIGQYNACAADILQAATDLGFTCTEFDL